MVTWFILVGAVLVVMALSRRIVERLPLSPALIYLAIGWGISQEGSGLLALDPVRHAKVLEVITEIAVLITLFAVGLRMRMPLSAPRWRAPIRLAGAGMVATTFLAALAGYALLDLPVAAAVLLAAVLSPTDPVLASEVQVHSPDDRDAVRLSLTAEGGINDGTAFPAVMLALGLFGVHEIGDWGWRWFAVDVLWAIAAGIGLGWLCGIGVGRAVVVLRARGLAIESEEFLVLGVIALTYGLALQIHSYGFLAVFAAGAGVFHVERQSLAGVIAAAPPSETEATHSSRLVRFAGQCEHLVEVTVVLLIGALLATVEWSLLLLAYAAAMLLVVRPLTVLLVLPRQLMPPHQRRLVAWFGIRGVGSIYYLSYAIAHGAPADWAREVADAALVTIAVSIIVHGVSATPLMERYRKRREQEQGA
ncbi:cation:proton antiporter [Caldimonas tepidiphila]|uniref:cation:proton antiporter n=1 Tax=Caldimonas tepidiphila TaxID=2315841 RepID=UPI000E5AA07C|nr:cation:proton antiporter [Caldimonas tepidiphila]